MMKNLFFAMLALVAAVFVGCDKEDDVELKPKFTLGLTDKGLYVKGGSMVEFTEIKSDASAVYYKENKTLVINNFCPAAAMVTMMKAPLSMTGVTETIDESGKIILSGTPTAMFYVPNMFTSLGTPTINCEIIDGEIMIKMNPLSMSMGGNTTNYNGQYYGVIKIEAGSYTAPE